MTWLHTWFGLVVCWLLYFMFITGSAGYFDEEIDAWMKPEQLPQQHSSFADAIAAGQAYLQKSGLEPEFWTMIPPYERDMRHLRLFWTMPKDDEGNSERGSEDIDVVTAEAIEEVTRDTGGGQFLYRMHYVYHYIPQAITYPLLAGIVTMMMFVGLISGIIVHKKIFKDFFTFRAFKGKRSWLDMHNLLSVATLPFQLMITYSGLVFVMLTFMGLIAVGSYGFDIERGTKDFNQAFGQIQSETAGEPAKLTSLAPLIQFVQQEWGDDVRSVAVRHSGDANALIVFNERTTGGVPRDRYIFDGVTGEDVTDTFVNQAAAPQALRIAMFNLHEGLFAGTLLRWLYFLSGLLGAAMIATGAIYWTEKRRKKSDVDHGRGFRLVENLNIGTIVGLPIGIAVYFLANRLLPLDFAGRAEWEAHSLFITWAVLVIYPMFRTRHQAWKEQCLIAAVTYAAIPIVNALTTDVGLSTTLSNGDWVRAGFDLTMVAIAAGFAVTAVILHRLGSKPGDAVTGSATRSVQNTEPEAV
ncbi:MAG: PepSY-associated TM helix domain-containing protein [Pseudomonadota bacterium]